MALPLGTPAHAQEPLACFRTGKGCKRTAMPARKGTGNTPQHGGHCCCPGTATQRDGEAEGRRRSLRLSKPRYLGTDKETKNYFLLFLVSSGLLICQSVCQAGRQALSMSEYCLYTWIRTHTHTHPQSLADRHVLCLSHFFFVTFLSFSISTLVMLHCLWLYGAHGGDDDDDDDCMK